MYLGLQGQKGQIKSGTNIFIIYYFHFYNYLLIANSVI